MLTAWEELKTAVIYHYSVDYSDASADPKPAYIEEDEAGNIKGLTFSRQDYVSGIILAEQIDKLLTNQANAQGDYKTTLVKIVTPDVRR